MQVTGVSLGYSQLMMFGIYSLIIWFGGQEIASGRATFDQMLKALFAVLFAAMGLAQVGNGKGLAVMGQGLHALNCSEGREL